jgi:hypothetical protein
MANKCPYCEYETPTDENGEPTARAWQEIAHMELDHPEIIKERLDRGSILDTSVRFNEEE